MAGLQNLSKGRSVKSRAEPKTTALAPASVSDIAGDSNKATRNPDAVTTFECNHAADTTSQTSMKKLAERERERGVERETKRERGREGGGRRKREVEGRDLPVPSLS